MKIEHEHKTIMGPVGKLFPKKDRYVPIIPEITANKDDHIRRVFIFWVIIEAVAAGIISKAETRITPTICSEVITVNANSIQKIY